MAEVENDLWWYRSLHSLVLKGIRARFKDRKDIAILDAGCGTGGLMRSLKRDGYHHVSGFDFSEHATRLCLKNGLAAKQMDIREVDRHYPPSSFDVIISNDVLYFLTPEERKALFPKLAALLREGGIFISNVPALDAFRGTHDVSVGIGKRFTRSSFLEAVGGSALAVRKTFFWPFLLSPMIYAVRLAQRRSLSADAAKDVGSDIDLPPKAVNTALETVMRIENKLLPWRPFGSSFFAILEKKQS